MLQQCCIVAVQAIILKSLCICYLIIRYIQAGNAVAVPVAHALGYALAIASQGFWNDDPLFTFPPKFRNFGIFTAGHCLIQWKITLNVVCTTVLASSNYLDLLTL